MDDTRTAEQIRSEIAAAEETHRREVERTRQLCEEVEHAKERQKLRDELALVRRKIASRKATNEYHSRCKVAIDRDEVPGWIHNPSHVHDSSGGKEALDKEGASKGTGNGARTGSVMNLGKSVFRQSFEWEIEGMSWLVDALEQHEQLFAESGFFTIADEDFQLVYNPAGSWISDASDGRGLVGSLALQHWTEGSLPIRHSFFVKACNGDWVQWGKTCQEFDPDWTEAPKAFGPDIQVKLANGNTATPVGIFGLSHSELLQSDWIHNDTLSVKVDVALRHYSSLDTKSVEKHVTAEVPATTNAVDLVSLLSTGQHSDVTIIVQGERIEAHAAILSARSEVFKALLDSGMREVASKKIVIDDCSVAIFNLLLKFLYSDDLTLIENGLCTQSRSSDSGRADSFDSSRHANHNSRASMLKDLLSVSHKYQVRRLCCWCEKQLCDGGFVSVNNVCTLLCHAHLHEAKSLERFCLDFITGNMVKVVTTAEFGRLAATWPEVILKINLHAMGRTEDEAPDALQEARRKRQRLEPGIATGH